MAKQVGETTVNSALMGFAFSAAGASKKAVVNSINTNIENTISRLQTQVNSNIDTTKTEPNKIDALIPNDNGIKLDEDKVIAGMWEDAESTSKNTLNTNVEKSRFKNVENLSDDDIIRMAKEYLQSQEGQEDTRPYLRSRPSYGKNQEQAVYDNGKNIFGNVYDPSGSKVPWDPTKPRKGQWDMGHIPGQKYSVVHSKYVIEMMTPKEFVEWYRDPKNYRPELPSTNRSHKYEKIERYKKYGRRKSNQKVDIR